MKFAERKKENVLNTILNMVYQNKYSQIARLVMVRDIMTIMVHRIVRLGNGTGRERRFS